MPVRPQDDDSVILVDQSDNEVGTASKMAAHRGSGMLHRAFSVYVFDSSQRLLIQRRSSTKYHFGGVWANTCCSHPRPGEAVMDAAHRRLNEEMGFDCPLEHRFSFVYHAVSPNGLVEHELDHVFTGAHLGSISPNQSEVDAWKWIDQSAVLREIEEKPSDFAPWFRTAAPRVFSELHAVRRP